MMSLLTTSTQHCNGGLAIAASQEKKIRSHKNGTEKPVFLMFLLVEWVASTLDHCISCRIEWSLLKTVTYATQLTDSLFLNRIREPKKSEGT